MAGAYSSSKAAVIAITKAVGKDVAGTGILVNCIAPAVINTPILGAALAGAHRLHDERASRSGGWASRTRSRR